MANAQMMRLLVLFLVLSLTVGCDRFREARLKAQQEANEVLFWERYCALPQTEQRKFTYEEWDWRSANAPWNLTKDVSVNKVREDKCP